jgi:hypothetical protein
MRAGAARLIPEPPVLPGLPCQLPRRSRMQTRANLMTEVEVPGLRAGIEVETLMPRQCGC